MSLDAKSLAVTEFLGAIESCRETLQGLQAELRLREQVRFATVSWPSFTGRPYHISQPNGEVIQFQNAAQIDLSVHLKSQRAMDWLVEVWWNESGWLIETSIYVDSNAPRAAGMDLLRDFQERYAETLDELTVQVKAAARELVENVDAIDEAIAMDAATATDKSGN